MPLLGREKGTQVFRDLGEHPGDEQFAGVVILRLDGGLFFATSDALEDRVREVALSMPDTTGFVLDCEGIDFVDSQGSAKMDEILDLTQNAGATLRLARVKPAVEEVLRRDGFYDRLGEDRVHGNVHRAVEAQLGADASKHRRRESGCQRGSPGTAPGGLRSGSDPCGCNYSSSTRECCWPDARGPGLFEWILWLPESRHVTVAVGGRKRPRFRASAQL